MRLEYSRALEHNSWPGNAQITCRYQQLHSILKGDATVKAEQLQYSNACRDELGTSGELMVSQELFCTETPLIVSLEDIQQNVPGKSCNIYIYIYLQMW